MNKMTSFFATTFFSLAILTNLSSISMAAAPGAIAYQGKLTNAAGDPVPNGSYDMIFAITDAGGAIQGSEVTQSVSTVNGVFSTVILFDAALFQASTDRYLQVKRKGAALPFTPRQKLVASPYALAVAEGSVGIAEINPSILNVNNGLLQLDPSGMVPDALLNSVATAKILNNAVTNTKLASDVADDGKRAVSSNHIQTNAVTDSKLASDVADDGKRAVSSNHIKTNAVTTAKIPDGAVTKEKLKQTDLGLLYEAADGRLLKTPDYTSALCDVTVVKNGDDQVTGVSLQYKNCDTGACDKNSAQSCIGAPPVGRFINLP